MRETITALDGVAISAERRLAIEAEQIHSLYRGAGVGLAASLAAACILCALFWQLHRISHGTLEIWLSVMLLQTAMRMGLLASYRHLAPPPDRRRQWRNFFTLGAAAGGLTWGLGAVAMIAQADFETQLLLSLVISGLIYASLSGFGSYQPFYALLFCSFAPMVVWSALQGDIRHGVFAALGTVWMPVAAWLGRQHDRDVVASFHLRYQNFDLMRDLQVQKERAEQANTAKSRFLASASHDLRQPVHALGMFVGALRSHEMGEPARRLLTHVENSIGALDGLFTSLLDISRLDAGVINRNIGVFSLGAMVERVVADLGPEIAGKGLVLRVVATDAWVESDPVLIERILRNLLSNAVRYTQRGRILVGCRGGRDVRLQIWDTGPGIDATHREKVFEEFFQVANPGRDRSQGLGLGLAIVRRLTQLLGHPLRMQSEPGRGTMFEVTLPRGRFVAPAAASLSARPPAQGLVLVVDDEEAVCAAMRSLLESWGHTVLTAGSGAQMLALTGRLSAAPDLIISDYRLQGDDNGIAVIRMLRSEFNEDIPALLITGDTAPDRLAQARASGLLLLHKPVPADRLRAAVASLLAAPD